MHKEMQNVEIEVV